MKLKFLSVVLLTASVSALAVACGGAAEEASPGDTDDVTNDEANAAKITAGNFKLYDQPRATPNPSCDVHTKIDLKSVGGSSATLSEGLGGTCEIYVVPNPRTYKLKDAGGSCGSRIFTGSVTKGGKKYAVKITDHRKRVCEDVIPALLIVEETVPGFPGAITTTKYSFDGAPGGTAITAEGTLTRTMGIGGENTGYSIATASGMLELVLDAGEKNQFVEGKKARVKGDSKLLSGVETRDRKAIDVKEMLVCPNPGTINCMPGPNVRLSSLCSGESSQWVSANCQGVNFVY